MNREKGWGSMGSQAHDREGEVGRERERGRNMNII